MKKKLLVIAAIAICLAILAGGSFAFYSTGGTAHNVITTSRVDIRVVEWQEDGEGNKTDYPTQPIPVMPSVQVSKVVAVENLAVDCYVRVKLDLTVKKADETVLQTQLGSDGSLPHLTNEKNDVLTLDIQEGWTFKEGWWYWEKPLSPTTSMMSGPLFKQVSFSGPYLTNEYQNTTVDILVTAQAVQAANNPIPAGGITAVPGWPTENANP